VLKVHKGKDTDLTSAEISQLWGTYMGDSSQVCVLTYFLEIVEDEEIKKIVEDALASTIRHVEKITSIFQQQGIAVPIGFKVGEDVLTCAPKLYSDAFILEDLHQFGRVGIRTHGINLSLMVRADCTDFFKECFSDAVRIYEMAKEVLLAKGLFIRSPYIDFSQKVDFVEEQNFLAGFFGDKRPLTAPEITNLYANFQRNALGAANLLGYSQVAKSEEVSQYLIRGKEIAEKHCEIFKSYLKEDDLPASLYWDSQVTETTLQVFSDKLMMFITNALTGAGMGFYGMGLGSSFRRDLNTLYNRLLLEIQLYGEDGANIMIKHGWLESPPKAT
jgi:hypothetical protein